MLWETDYVLRDEAEPSIESQGPWKEVTTYSEGAGESISGKIRCLVMKMRWESPGKEAHFWKKKDIKKWIK